MSDEHYEKLMASIKDLNNRHPDEPFTSMYEALKVGDIYRPSILEFNMAILIDTLQAKNAELEKEVAELRGFISRCPVEIGSDLEKEKWTLLAADYKGVE